MPLTEPAELRDHADDWMAFFNEHRREELRAVVTPEIVEEFRLDPHGARGRSLVLRQTLNYLRMQPIEGRVFAYAAEPFRTYHLAVLKEVRGAPPTIMTDVAYPTEEEAIAAAFVKRLELVGILDDNEGKA